LCLLGRGSTTSAILPALLALVNFETVSCIYAWASQDLDPSIYTPYLFEMTGAYHHAKLLLIEIGFSRTFCQC
jgi:hypothetical protein